jgi:hypothetical protein
MITCIDINGTGFDFVETDVIKGDTTLTLPALYRGKQSENCIGSPMYL